MEKASFGTNDALTEALFVRVFSENMFAIVFLKNKEKNYEKEIIQKAIVILFNYGYGISFI